MGSAKCDDPCLDFGNDLVRTTVGPGTPVGKGAEAFSGVSNEPAVDGSAIDAVAGRDVGDLGAVQHLPDRQVALLNHGQLLQHREIPLGPVGRK
jgi:hypothetical protein